MLDAIGRSFAPVRRDANTFTYKSAVVGFGNQQFRRDLTITVTGASNRHLRRRAAKFARLDAKRHAARYR